MRSTITEALNTCERYVRAICDRRVANPFEALAVARRELGIAMIGTPVGDELERADRLAWAIEMLDAVPQFADLNVHYSALFLDALTATSTLAQQRSAFDALYENQTAAARAYRARWGRA